ncbi:hypothetical protein M3J09_006316 [Ascochyta lentis]
MTSTAVHTHRGRLEHVVLLLLSLQRVT